MDPVHEQLQQSLSQRYRIDRELGGGGMSRVFLSTEIALDRHVVLKVLPPELASAVSVERFKREISLAARLQHAHIVPLLAAGDANGLPWFSMPFVDGQSLRSRLGAGELPIADVVRTLRDVASALAYAHGKGVVHRDIKPENILLSEGSAVVTDFGVAKALLDAGVERGSGLTSAGVALGTPAYMAPEQIAGDPRTDHRADIYALGVVAYEMLAGHNPFAGRSLQMTMAAHMTEAPTPVERVRTATPALLAQLVARCMAKSAADRPQSAQEIVNAIDALATPTGTMPLAVPGALADARPRGKALRLATMALAAVAVFGAAWSFSRRAAAAPTNLRRVAIAPCENLTRDSSLASVANIATDYLTRLILEADSVDVVSGTTVAAIVADTKGASGDVVQRIGAATHAGTIIACSVSKLGDSLRVEAKIIDAHSGSIRRALEPGVGPASDPLAAMAALRERLLGSLVAGDLAHRIVVNAGQPPKYSAYLAFMDGDARITREDYAGATPYLERAVALDSTFSVAYFSLAMSYRNTGRLYDADRTTAMLEQRRDRLPASDREMLDLLTGQMRGNNASALDAATKLAHRTDDPLAWYKVGQFALNVLRAPEALAAYKIADSAADFRAYVPQVTRMAQAYHLVGDYRGELARLEQGRREVQANGSLRARNLVGAELRAYAGLHEPARALALADTLMRESVESNIIAALNEVVAGANEFAAHGDTATFRQLARLGLKWLRAHPVARPSAARNIAEAHIWFANDQLDSARTHLMAASAAGDTAISIGGYLGIIAATLGNRARATAIADSLAALNLKWSYGSELYWQAAILGTTGRKDEAVALLKSAEGRGQSMANWHADPALYPLRGYAAFEALVAVRK